MSHPRSSSWRPSLPFLDDPSAPSSSATLKTIPYAKRIYLLFIIVVLIGFLLLFQAYRRKENNLSRPQIAEKLELTGTLDASFVEEDVEEIEDEDDFFGSNKPYFDVLVLISTSSTKVNNRNQQRNTWQKHKMLGLTYRHLYFVGTTGGKISPELEREQKQHGDMVFLTNYEDSYRNLTQKIHLSMTYAYANYHFSFALKTDDDVFVRPVVLEKKLIELKQIYGKKIYAGFMMQNMPVLKEKGHRNSDLEFDDVSSYPPYMSGSGYILSYDLIEFLSTTPFPLRMLVNEDASVGLWLAPHEINRIDLGGMIGYLRWEDYCEKQEKYWILLHYMTDSLFSKCYKLFVESGFDERQSLKARME